MRRGVQYFSTPNRKDRTAIIALIGRRSNHRLTVGQDSKEILLTLGIKFTKDVVKEQDRGFSGSRLEYVKFGKLQRQGSGALLSLACERPGISTVDKNAQVVAVGTDRRGP